MGSLSRTVITSVASILLVMVLGAGPAACATDGAGHSASDEELVEFIAARYELLQDHRERCDALLRDFETEWRSASREEAFPVLGVLSSVEGETVWTLLTWERMPEPEAAEVAELNGAFFDHLSLVLASSRLVSRSIGFSHRSTKESRERAARDAAVKLDEARAAEGRLEALLRQIGAHVDE